jgi:hypothetical protein
MKQSQVNGSNRIRQQDRIYEKSDGERNRGKLRNGELDAKKNGENQDSNLYQPRQPLPIFQFRMHGQSQCPKVGSFKVPRFAIAGQDTTPKP